MFLVNFDMNEKDFRNLGIVMYVSALRLDVTNDAKNVK